MGFFSNRFNRPGPGVSPEEPRKKGFARLFEILGRDFWSFFKAGFLAFLGSIPFILGTAVAVISHAVLFVVIVGVVGGMIASPQIVGMADTVLRSLRDEPGFWWETYKRSWKRNFKVSLVPGAICGLVFAVQIFTLFHLVSLGVTTSTMIMAIVSVVLSLGLTSYIFPQVALVDLPFSSIFKNAALLFLGYLPRSAGALAVNLVYWGFIVLFFPATFYLLPFTNFWLPMVPSLLIVYKPLEKSFNIEETIKQMREDQLRSALDQDESKVQ